MKPGVEDVDVFLGPHAHMRVLLDRMKVRLANTDFRDRNSVATLLFELQYIFSEFKNHEEIEDMYIVDELRSRMLGMVEEREGAGQMLARQGTPAIALDKDMHGDQRLTTVIHVITNVMDVTRRNTCNRVIRLRQGQRLCEVLDEFTVDFVPHMAEEEQVFQPLLSQYFTALELIRLRDKVTLLHTNNIRVTSGIVSRPLSGQAWWIRGLPALPSGGSPPEQPIPDVPPSCIVEIYESTTTIDSLPTEVLLKILKLLDDVPSLLRASEVCRYWRTLAFDGSLWRSLRLRQWFLKNWHFSVSQSYAEHPDESDEESDDGDEDGSSSPDEEGARKERLGDYEFVDDDDLDSSVRVDRGAKSAWRDGKMRTLHSAEEESRFFYSVCNSLLPMVGRHIRVLSLHGSTSLTNDLLRRILYLCPNIEHLSIAYTNVSTFGLDCRLHRRLTRVSASACRNISDVSLQSLAMCLRQNAAGSTRLFSELGVTSRSLAGSHASLTNSPPSEGSSRSGSRTGSHRDLRGGPSAWYLDLSGCHMLTDQGLAHLIGIGPFPELRHLDLSGLSRITGATVKRLVGLCLVLPPERFYYCERIPHDNDELMKTAEMCRGICHKGIACCRFVC